MLQIPAPGEHKLFFRGDVAEVRLVFDYPAKGEAFFRTNLGKAEVVHREIINAVETGITARGEGWHDLPMKRVDACTFAVKAALLEVGHFEGKCLFFADGTVEPVWVEGDNIQFNVEPGEYCAGNTIYCAFPRQFGRHKGETTSDDYSHLKSLTEAGYSVLPPSGTFRDLKRELDFIFDKLGSRILHLLPINPTPTVYGRMGVFGSPYAALDFTAVDPALAEFDKSATPLQQFCELVDEVHLKNGKVFIDIAINHTGWAAKIHETHPHWVLRDKNNEIVSPGAWGVTWGDLTELDHSCFDLWKYLADSFLTWCSRGVDGFRCDAGYMIPLPAWRYIIARVRLQYPDTVFLLEGLGGDPKITEELLNKGNMNWAYSELFQNYSKQQITGYMRYADRISSGQGLMFHYAETHDNNRLAAVSDEYAMMRTGLCAMLSSSGAFGFTNGVEWFAKEKIDVHMDKALNWGAKKNQVEYISKINHLLRMHPAFFANAQIAFLETSSDSSLAFTRCDKDGKNRLIILINMDHQHPQDVKFHCKGFALGGERKCLLTSEPRHFISVSNHMVVCKLGPGEVVCVEEGDTAEVLKLTPSLRQWAQGVVLDYMVARKGSIVVEDENITELSELLLEDPAAFCRTVDNGSSRVIEWESPQDLERMVMIPPGHGLLIRNKERFRARVADDRGIVRQLDSIELHDGTQFVLFPPFSVPSLQSVKSLVMYLYGKELLSRHEAKLLFLSNGDDYVSTQFNHCSIIRHKPLFLATNKKGGMCHVPINRTEIYSRYNALLAANLNPDYPVDRQVMFTRLRGWVKHHGYSHAFDIHALNSFMQAKDGEGVWSFNLPVGNGRYTSIEVVIKMDDEENRIYVTLRRKNCKDSDVYLADSESVRIILRPDIEDRNFHHDTKAMYGPETHWPASIVRNLDGFDFKPSIDRTLSLKLPHSTFYPEGEWNYCVHHEVEASRGLEEFSDLYSPGYFDFRLGGGEARCLTAAANCEPIEPAKTVDKYEPETNFEKIMEQAIEQFIVNRDGLKTVIAGYPWFLDWGRDTLICVRGIIAAGSVEEYKQGKGLLKDTAGILQAFARFEENGTLPNMIHGDDAGNRETSDAPLWLFTATKDFVEKTGDVQFLQSKPKKCNRTMTEILTAIADGYIAGTPNGIRVDEASGLVYSPSHFTWMDTNYPAGTPREGYPIEIQALWYAALSYLYEITKIEKWRDLSDKVKTSIQHYFVSDKFDYLSDCLHTKGFMPASQAIADDALRSNQLLAVTLGAIDDMETAKKMVKSAEKLLVPGAMRSLANQPVTYPLPVVGANGNMLNDPNNPYWGFYKGDEDTRRKPAYHNGTAWTWPFPSWAEAYLMVYGSSGRQTAKAVLASSKYLLKHGCIGQLPEIIDGSYPHKQRGCDAQAWGVTELYRVWKMLS